MKRELVTIRGRVQGVGFRATVLEHASRFAVAGSVRNTPAGAVAIDVEGDAAAVDAFVAAVIAEPPPFARITSVERHDAAPRGAAGFVSA